jgi:hypothetical protein
VIAGRDAPKLLPVVVTDSSEVVPTNEPSESGGGSIHIEFPGRVLVTIEPGVDPALASAVLERLTR